MITETQIQRPTYIARAERKRLQEAGLPRPTETVTQWTITGTITEIYQNSTKTLWIAVIDGEEKISLGIQATAMIDGVPYRAEVGWHLHCTTILPAKDGVWTSRDKEFTR